MSQFYPIKSIARSAKFHFGLSFLLCLAVAELVAQPTFVNLPSNTTIDCEDAWPSSGGVSAISDCPGDVQVDTFVAETGNTVSSCSVSTAFGPGIDWAVWLPVLAAPSVAWNFIGTPSLEFYANGTARLTGIIQNAANAAWQMEVDVFFENGRDWSAWSALGRNYKNDFGLAGSNYLNWSYYELNSVFSRFTGIGELEGSELSLQHMPANYYFGFQVGLAANNKNANDGLSGWFTYTGTFNGASVNGNGDINVDKACQSVESGCGSTQFTYLYRAEDACGNVSYAESTVTKVDAVAPVFAAVESPLYVSCLESGNTFVTATDACSAVSISFTDEVLTAGCPGLVNRTYTAADGCGNTAQVSQLIYFIVEGDLEFINFPADANVNCEQASSINPAVEYSAVCINTILAQSDEIIAGSCPANYTLVRTYTLTDDCGNSVSRAWTVQVTDTQAPSIIGVPVSASLNCGEEIPSGTPTVSDNCSDFTLISNTVVTQQQCGSTTTTFWTATDLCGNVYTAQQVVVVEDNNAPVFIQAPSDIELNCGVITENGSSPIVEDDCSDVSITYSDEITGTQPCSGSIIRHWIATDACGNVATFDQSLNYSDTEAPTILTSLETLAVDCNSIPDADVTSIAFSDNCSGNESVAVSEVIVPGTCSGSYSIERTYTVTDGCGNSASVLQVINVSDNNAPVFGEVQSPVTADCSAISTVSISVADNCSGVELTYTDEVLVEGCPGVIIRTYTATDGCGNTSQVQQTIYTVTESGTPEFTNFPPDASISCEDAAALNPVVEYSAGCINTTLTQSDEIISGSCPANYTLVRTYTLTDDCGNSVSRIWTVQVADTQAPSITGVPVSSSLNCGDEVPSGTPTASDNCSDFTLTSNTVVTQQECGSTTTTVWTASDACGNVSTAQQVVSIDFNENLLFTYIPASVTIACGEPFELDTAIVAESCTNVTLSWADEPLNDCAGSYIRIWRAFDGCGNQAIESTVVTVVDEESPILIGVPAQLLGSCGAELELPQVTAVDNCDSNVEVTVTETSQPGNCGLVATYTWTATDACGNATSVSCQLLITDNVAPTITSYPEDTTVGCDLVPAADASVITYQDNCSSAVVTVNDLLIPGGCPAGYNIERTYTVTDGCGNSASAMQTIYVVDELAPVIFGMPSDTTINCGEEVSITTITATDNCSSTEEITFAVEDQYVLNDCGSTLLRVYMASDACGNTTSIVQNIYILDSTPPSFVSVPSDLVLNCGETPSASDLPIAQDDCSAAVTVTYADSIEQGVCGYTVVRTFSATDACGNVANAQQIITYTDNVAPTITTYPEDTTVGCDLVPAADASVITYQDNCSTAVVTVNDLLIPGGCPSGYNIERTYTVTDGCGNSASAMQTIYVVDEVAPVIFGMPSDTTISCGEEVSITAITATDNCSSTEDITFAIEDQYILNDCGSILLRVYMASDACGNTTSIVQNIYIVDSSAPVFVSFPSSANVACDEVVPVEDSPINYADDCSQVSVSWQEQIIAGDCPSSYISVRTCTLTDGCGNSTVASYTLNVSDTESPVLTGLPSDVTIECGDSMPVANVTAWDNCSAQPEFFLAEAMETIGCVTYLTRRWTALDECGNLTQEVQVVTILDETAPTLSAYPESIVLACGQSPEAAPVLTANDGCTGTVQVVFTETPLATGSCGGLQRRWCATDCSGNEECHTQFITYQPQALPVGMNAQLEAWQTATNRIALELIANESARWNVDLLDLNGRRIDTWFSGDMNAGETRMINADIDFLVSGIYFVQFSNGTRVITKRIPIVRN